MKITVFWGVTSCSLVATFVKLGQSTKSHILETVMLMVILEIISYQVSPNIRYSATLTIEAVGIFETMANFYQITGASQHTDIFDHHKKVPTCFCSITIIKERNI
jgi:hypothetical protein